MPPKRKTGDVERIAEICHEHWRQRLSALLTSATHVKIESGITTMYLIDGDLRIELHKQIACSHGGMPDGVWKEHTREEARELIAALTGDPDAT